MVEVEKLYADHLSNVKMEMDGYVIDMHTRKMKWSPRLPTKNLPVKARM